MPTAQIVSDRAIFVDLAVGAEPLRASHNTSRVLDLRDVLLKALSGNGLSGFQCVCADLSLTLLLQRPDYSAMQQAHAVVSAVIESHSVVADNSPNSTHATHILEVQYGGVWGPDLEWLAVEAGLSKSAVIDLHTSATFTVQFLGFLPGFAYLAGLPQALVHPRRKSPRPKVPAGSVAVGGPYCAVYPWDSPGGWHLLGHVKVTLFDPHAAGQCMPARLQAGDQVRFRQAEHA